MCLSAIGYSVLKNKGKPLCNPQKSFSKAKSNFSPYCNLYPQQNGTQVCSHDGPCLNFSLLSQNVVNILARMADYVQTRMMARTNVHASTAFRAISATT